MTGGDVWPLLLGFLQGAAGGTVFVLALFIGFCVLFGFFKLKATAGEAMVVKSLDERLTHHAVTYLPPDAPRGPADQLRAPDLLERK